MRRAWLLLSATVSWGCNVVSGLSDFGVTQTGAGGAPPACAGCGEPIWARAFGDTAVAHGRSIAVDAEGSIFVAGFVNAAFSFGGGALPYVEGWDGVVAKLDAEGAHLWSAALVGATDQLVDAVAITPAGDVVVAGTFATEIVIDGLRHPETVDALEQDAFVACLDAQDGTRKWSKTFGGASVQRVRAVAVDAAGDIYLAGDLVEGMDIEGNWVPGFGPGLGTSDGFVIRLGSAGEYRSHQIFGDAANDNARAWVMDGDSSHIGALEFEGTINLGPGPLGAVGRDAVVFRSTDEGLAWQVHLSGTGDQLVSGVAADGQGGAVVAGTFVGSLQVGTQWVVSHREAAYLVAIDASGGVVWLRHFVGARAGGGTSVVGLDARGHALLTGSFFSWMAVNDDLLVAERTLAAQPSRDAFLLQVDGAGDVWWSRAFGSTGNDAGTALAVGALGDTTLVGDLDGSATLGDQSIQTSADIALLVAKFAP